MIYFTALALLYVFALQKQNNKCWKIHYKAHYALLALLLIGIAGFRYGLEADYWAYHAIFMAPAGSALVERYEPGFMFLVNFYKRVFSPVDYNGFVFCFALLSVGLKILYFARMKNSIIALYVYFTLLFIALEMNGIRQGIAISVLYLAFERAKSRQLLPFLLLVALATTLHASSLLFLPMYVIANKTLSIRTIVLLAIASVITKFFIVPLILKLLGKIDIPLLHLYVLSVKSHLLYGDSGRVFTVGFFRRLVILGIFVCLIGKWRFCNPYFTVYFVGTLLYVVFMGNETMAGRMSQSFEAFSAPFAASLAIKRTWKRTYLLLIYMALCMLLFFAALHNSPNALPYQTYLWGVQ